MKDEDAADESGNVDKFDPLVESLEAEDESEQNTIQVGLPTDPNGHVPDGLTIRVRRTAKHKDHRGIAFCTQDGPLGAMKQVMIAEPTGWTTSGSREELVFTRGAPPSGSHIGMVDFHNWLDDQHKHIVVKDIKGIPMELTRLGMGSTHEIQIGGKQFIWQRSRGHGHDRSFGKSSLECIDAKDKVYAFYTSDSHKGDAGQERRVGRLEIKAEGLSVELVETLLMNFVAVFVKLQKRVQQGSMLTGVLHGIGG